MLGVRTTRLRWRYSAHSWDDFKLGARPGRSRRAIARGIAETRASESACPTRVDRYPWTPSLLDVSSRPPSRISSRRSTVVRMRLVEVKAGVDVPGQIGCRLLAQQLGGPSFRFAERRRMRRHVETFQDPSRHTGVSDCRQGPHPPRRMRGNAARRPQKPAARDRPRPCGRAGEQRA